MWSVRKALALTFVAVVSLPLAMFWFWPHTRAMQNEVQQVEDKHLLLARNLSTGLERYARDLATTFNFIADSLLSDRAIDLPAPLLRSLNIRHVCMVDLTTGLVSKHFTSNGDSSPGQMSEERIGQLVELASSRPELPGGVIADVDGVPALPIARVMGNRLVFATIETSHFRELAGAVSFGRKGHAVVVDHTGRVLAHPMPHFRESMVDLSALTPVGRLLKGEAGVDTFFSPALQETMIAGFAAVPFTGWGVLVPQPLRELTEAANRVHLSALWVFAMGLIISALVALRFGLLLINPLNNVIRGADRMAKGEAGVQISVPGRFVPRELKALAATFNRMAVHVTEAQAREAEARGRAETANTQKTEFVRYITHELRSPINAILGFARVLTGQVRQTHNATTVEQVRHIQQAGTHLLSLVNDLLDLGKMEAGQYRLNEVEIGVDELIERCFRMVGETARARSVTLTASYGRAPTDLHADERAMYQVLLNLVTNAVRYGHKGGSVEVRAGVRRGDGAIEICVIDDGPGIAAEDLGRVMKPFERIERTGDPGQQGTGLGLPIVKRLVELHGGRFTLTSQLGVGTVAYVELPASRHIKQDKRQPVRAAA